MRGLLGTFAYNWQLKLAAFAIAIVLWFVVQGDKPYTYRMSLPVRVANQDAEWVLTREPSPSHVVVEFSGAYRDLIALRSADPSIVVPVQDVRDSVQRRALQRSWVDVGSAEGSVAVGPIRPDTVRLAFDRSGRTSMAMFPMATSWQVRPSSIRSWCAPAGPRSGWRAWTRSTCRRST